MQLMKFVCSWICRYFPWKSDNKRIVNNSVQLLDVLHFSDLIILRTFYNIKLTVS